MEVRDKIPRVQLLQKFYALQAKAIFQARLEIQLLTQTLTMMPNHKKFNLL